MTEQERVDVRTAYRPLIEGLAGKPGTISYEEWAAAVDRVFPTDGAAPESDMRRAREDIPQLGPLSSGHPKDFPNAHRRHEQ